jgi:hypothetical protein
MSDQDQVGDRNILYKQVKTTPIRVNVVLVDGTKIEGTFHQPPSLRLLDMLNRHTQDNPFIAVTDAYITFPSGDRSHYKFFSVNRAMILCCFPLEEEILNTI